MKQLVKIPVFFSLACIATARSMFGQATCSQRSVLSKSAFVGTTTPVSTLLEKHAGDIDFLKQKASGAGVASIPTDDMFYLRYCLAFDGSNKKKGDINNAAEALVENLQWRNGEGKTICTAAESAVEEATSSSSWDNSPVRNNAPHASVINEYIGPSQVLTVSSDQKDLVYCIRAGRIDDVALMSRIAQEDMMDFFLYAKEVLRLVADLRSTSTDHLVTVITANDLSGTSLKGDPSFRAALSQSSTKANELFPALSGPTLLLNLPPLLGALAKLFTPLFPAEVRKRLKFEQGPLKDVKELTELLPGAGNKREVFMKQLDDLVYSAD